MGQKWTHPGTRFGIATAAVVVVRLRSAAGEVLLLLLLLLLLLWSRQSGRAEVVPAECPLRRWHCRVCVQEAKAGLAQLGKRVVISENYRRVYTT